MAFTDNRNRSASEIRRVFDRNGGKMGQVGTVNYLFDQRGVITLELDAEKAEDVALMAIDRGAEDFTIDGSVLEIVSSVDSFEGLRQGLEAEGLTLANAEIAMVPKTLLLLEERHAEQAIRLLDRLEDLDDVQKVFSNADFPTELLEKLGDAA
jgi:transcriptional/translational regulatory protein YebC/TACO1